MLKRLIKNFSAKYKFLNKTLCFPIDNPIFPSVKININF